MAIKQWRVLSMAAVIAMLAGAIAFHFVAADPQPKVVATDVQAKTFYELYRRYERIQFTALATGDTSQFTTIFYNDPTVEILPELADIEKQYHDQVVAALTINALGPVGADTGFLSASVADMLRYWDNVEAWEAVQARAASEARQPSIQDLPAGYQPIERKQLDEWVNVPASVHDVVVQGAHATFTISFDPSGGLEGTLMHFTCTQVNEQWYISSITGSGDA